jgi:predicted thioesterase
MKVWSESTLVEVDRRKLVFRVSAYDEKGLIGEGVHERFLIDTAKFLAKTGAKNG